MAITGLGAVCCAGDDVESLWRAALEQRSSATWLEETIGGRRIACCRARTPTVVGMREGDFARLDRFAQLGVAAGRQAWDDAGVEMGGTDPRRVAVVSGTSRGPIALRHDQLMSSRRRRPTDAVYGSTSSLTGALSALVGARGPSSTVSATCASSAVALNVAAMQIAAGACDVALVGGADAPLHPEFVAELEATRVLGQADTPEEVCRPFDRKRTGILLGEAGAYLVLESRQHAEARGARILALLSGWSSACDPGRRSGMSEDARGVHDALTGALNCAGCEFGEIDAVHLHGTGTPLNDAAEAKVIDQLSKDDSAAVRCTSTKPITGHCLGASGALQAVINVRALESQCLPPTAGCEDLDPHCPINLVRGSPWHGGIHRILMHSAGFWGNHAGLIFERQ